MACPQLSELAPASIPTSSFQDCSKPASMENTGYYLPGVSVSTSNPTHDSTCISRTQRLRFTTGWLESRRIGNLTAGWLLVSSPCHWYQLCPTLHIDAARLVSKLVIPSISGASGVEPAYSLGGFEDNTPCCAEPAPLTNVTSLNIEIGSLGLER